jgi:hypothetical protein
MPVDTSQIDVILFIKASIITCSDLAKINSKNRMNLKFLKINVGLLNKSSVNYKMNLFLQGCP